MVELLRTVQGGPDLCIHRSAGETGGIFDFPEVLREPHPQGTDPEADQTEEDAKDQQEQGQQDNHYHLDDMIETPNTRERSSPPD